MDTNTVLAVIITALCLAAAYGMIIFYSKLSEISKSLKKSTPMFMYVYEHRGDVEKFARDFDEILRGGNKINQDAVDINTAMVREVVSVRKAVESLNSAIIQPEHEEFIPPSTLKTVQDQYDYDMKSLIEQGLNPEEAAYKAANWELDRMADRGIDANIGIGA